MIDLYYASKENDGFLVDHWQKENADLTKSLELSEEVNLVSVQLISQLKERIDKQAAKLRAVPPNLLAFISDSDFEAKHLLDEVVRFKYATMIVQG